METTTGFLPGICFAYPEPLVPGTLLRRYRRFLADIQLADGRTVTAHCPNSGSMRTCLEPGAAVYCSEHRDPKRRTAFTWEMIRIKGAWIGINTLVPNKLVAAAARRRALALFRDVIKVAVEVPIALGTRIDLVAARPQGPLVVEVKNVTLARGDEAHFPDAVTSRGAKHLQHLIRLQGSGTDCAMVYVVQRSDVCRFGPARDIDPNYGRLLDQARQAGVAVTAVQARVQPEGVCLVRELALLL